MAEEEKKPEQSESDKKKEDWMNSKWRPAMGWMYMMVCVFDFIVFPVMYTIVQFWETEAANDAFRQWQPLTLAGAGLFHMAMGAVLGLSAWGRTQEKLGGANNGGLQAPGSAPAALPAPSAGSFSAPSQPFGASSTGAFASSSMPVSDPGGIVMSPGGKPGPAPLPDPVR